MRLHLLALELLYAFKGSGRQHRVELLKEDDAAAGCFATYSRRSNAPASCTLHLPVGTGRVEIRAKPDTEMAVESPAGFVVGGRAGETKRRRGWVGWTGLRVSALAPQALNLWWCGMGHGLTLPASESALEGNALCSTVVVLTVMQCVWLNEATVWEPGKAVEAATGDTVAWAGSNLKVRTVYVERDPSEALENVVAKRPELPPTLSARKLFESGRESLAAARAAIDPGLSGAAAQKAVRQRLAAAWQALDRDGRRPWDAASQAQKVAQRAVVAEHDRQIVLRDNAGKALAQPTT
jgi:hypothetical protein